MKKFFLLALIFFGLTSQVLSESNNDPKLIVIIPFEKIGNNFPNQSLEEIILDDLNLSNDYKVSTSGVFGNKEINYIRKNIGIYSLKDYVVYGSINQIKKDNFIIDLNIYDVELENDIYQKKIHLSDYDFTKVGNYLSKEILLGTKTKQIAFQNIPIVINSFETDGFQPDYDIAEIITSNLNKSGRFDALNIQTDVKNYIDFDFWQKRKLKNVVFGRLEKKGSNIYDLYIYIYDVFSEKSLYQKKIRVHNSGLRRVAHFLSDKIYEVILDEQGSFDTKLAFIKVEDKQSSDGRTYRLQISDSDYYNAQTVVRSSTLIDSASFSPDRNKLAYVSNKNAILEVFVATPFIKSFPTRLPKFDDNIALSPSWHPDGKSILYTISKFGIQNIYNYNLESKKLKRLISSPGIDIGANYSPDGKNIVFTSNRLTFEENSSKAINDRKIEDKAQIFIKNLDTGRVTQVPIGGDYNAGAVYSPDGKKLGLIHGYGQKRTLALYDLNSNQLEVLKSSNNINTGVFIPKLSFSSNGNSLFYQHFKDNINYLSEINLNNYQSNQLALGPNANNDPILTIYEILDRGFLSDDDLDEYSDDALIEMAKAMRLDFKFNYNSNDVITNRDDLILAISINSYTFDVSETRPKTAEDILEQSNEKYGITSLEEAEERLKIAELEAKEAEERRKLVEEKAKLAEKSIQEKNETELLAKQAKNTAVEAEFKFWNSIEDSKDPDEYQLYLDQYPEGNFVELAKLRIQKLSIPAPKNIPKLDYGNYHALIIGNDKYRHLSPLSNAINDANDVAAVLRSKYNFNVNLLTNATRNEIVSALSKLRNSISSSDNLLVYYAGHGYLDKAADEGFWLPVDAEIDNDVHWVANETIMRSVRAMQAKHIMVVADSCFSGTLTRGIKIKDNSPNYIKKIVQKKARTVLTSGGLEPVSDVGGGNNSIFASSFLNALRDNDGVLDGNQLFSIIRKQVMLNSDQTPQYGDIRKAGHDGGDFIFVSE